MGDNLKQKTLNAVKWSAVDRFGQQALQLVIGIILARKLTPDDFGLVGLVAIFSAISFVLVESGFSQALMRKKDTTQTDYSTVFFFNLFVSILLYVVLFFSAPIIADFFRQPQLISICRVIFLGIIFNALYMVPFAQLNKAMDFKSIAQANILGVLVSGSSGIALVLNGFGVWSLVVQQVAFQFTRMIVYYFTLNWRPELRFSFQVIRKFWRFSVNLLGTAILNVIFNNLYVLILGKYYNINKAGNYTQANKLSETFNFSFLIILTTSSYPLFVQVQDDTDRFRQIYRSYTQKSSMLTFPAILTLIAIAKPLIFVLYSSKWLSAVPYFQLLCLASLFAVLYSLTVNALNARGKSSITFRLELIKKMLILASVFTCFNFGVIAMLIGYAAASFIAYLISIVFLKTEINHYIRHQVKDFIAPFLVGLVIASCCYAISFLIGNYYVLLPVQFILAVTIYIIWVKHFYPEIFRNILNNIKRMVSRYWQLIH